MNDELQKALAAILTKTTQAAEAGVSFLSQQLPEVIQQLLIWKAVESGVFFLLLSTIFLILAKISRGYIKKAREYKDKNTYDSGRENLYGFSIVSGLTAACCGIMAMTCLDWLKILIAPKVYLIEYAASLAK